MPGKDIKHPTKDAVKYSDQNKCPYCGIILELAPRHNCMAPLPIKEVGYGHSEWSITQIS